MPEPATVAYVVVTHDHPDLLRRLVTRLVEDDPACRVFVCHDAGGPSLGPLPGGDRVHVDVRPRAGGWGGWGIVEATLEGLKRARRDADPDWTVLLSGQDYPAVAPSVLRDRLAASPHDALLRAPHVLAGPPRDEVERWRFARYRYRWHRLPRHRGPRLPPRLAALRVRALERLSLAQPLLFVWTLPRGAGTAVGVRRPRTPFGPDYPCRVGSQWLALSRRGLAAVETELAARPALLPLYRRSIVPDESLLNTVVGNAPGLSVATPNLTFERPSGPGDAHAATLTLDDLDAVLASGMPLMRKAAPGDSDALLDALDAAAAAC